MRGSRSLNASQCRTDLCGDTRLISGNDFAAPEKNSELPPLARQCSKAETTVALEYHVCGAIPRAGGKSLFDQESVVADAVAFEPVSVAKFPANREKNREFAENGCLSGVSPSGNRCAAGVFCRIP